MSVVVDDDYAAVETSKIKWTTNTGGSELLQSLKWLWNNDIRHGYIVNIQSGSIDRCPVHDFLGYTQLVHLCSRSST